MYFEEFLLVLVAFTVMRYGADNKSLKEALGIGCIIVGLTVFVIQCLYIGGVLQNPIN